MSPKIKLKKTLYIGLGGTGIATLLKVKKNFIDSYGTVPPMIGFLAIDTDSAIYSKEITSNLGDQITLDNSELKVCTVQNALKTYKAHQNVYDWMPLKNTSNLRLIAGLGAGQVRSNGRFIAYYNYRAIQTQIVASITKIHQLIPQNSIFTVDTSREGIEYATSINVFSSLAGGTGSGMLIDILAIVKQAMEDLSRPYYIYPWLILPDIFTTNHRGPAMANVNYNTYGALRSLDYLQHMTPDKSPVNFGYTNIEEPLFDYAFVINNFNKESVSFDNIEDLTDAIARSAFMPANRMGDEIQSPFDNIRQAQQGSAYNILDKKAWAVSAGSAELIYDNQAIGKAYTYKTLIQLCTSLVTSDNDGQTEADSFIDSALIRKESGRNDVEEALLNPAPKHSLTIDEGTTIDGINKYIEDNTIADRVTSSLSENFNIKLSNTTKALDVRLNKLMNSVSNGCIGSSIAFLHCLKGMLKSYQELLEKEKKELNKKNSNSGQWEQRLPGIKKKGFFGGTIDKENADSLSQSLSFYISNLRKEKRTIWAIKFYNDLENILTDYEQKLISLSTLLKGIRNKYSDKLQKVTQETSTSTSKFKILLHRDDMSKVNQFQLDDSVMSDFHSHFADNGGLLKWADISKEQIDNTLLDYIGSTAAIKEISNISIDNILRKMPVEEIRSYIKRLLLLASPLWSYDTQGFNTERISLDRCLIVGVDNSDTSILSTDSTFSQMFDINGNKASFASTHQNDRVSVLYIEELLPIYAINNFKTYQRDYETKEKEKHSIAGYLDEKLNARIKAENFNLLPTIQKDDYLKTWVLGFIYGKIHFDEEDKVYWLESKSKGDAIHSYRYNLGKQRNIAYDKFKTDKLYEEVKSTLNNQLANEGKEDFWKKVTDIKEHYEKYSSNDKDDYYMTQCSHLSKSELSQIDEPLFSAVKNLINQEIELIRTCEVS